MSAVTTRIAARLALGLILAASTSACSTWRSQWDHPRSVLERAHPERVRVVREDGSETVLRQPRVSDDSLLGETERGNAVIPLSEVNHLEVKRGTGVLPAALLSIAMIAGVGALLAATWD